MTRSELWDLLDSPLDKTNGTPIGRKRDCAFSVKKPTYEASWTSKYVSVQICKFLFCSLNVLRIISMTNVFSDLFCFDFYLATMSSPNLLFFHLEMIWSV